MFSHPDLLLLQTAERLRDLRAEAAQYRLLAGARWARKQRRAAAKRRRQAARGQPAGTLAAWAAYVAQAR